MKHGSPVQAPDEALESLLRESAPGAFRAGFAGRVMARLQAAQDSASPPTAQADLFSLWTWRLFPRVAVAAALLAAGLAAWNLGAQREGVWLERLVSLPACTLENSLSQLEDPS